MPRTKLALVVAACLSIAAPTAIAGPDNNKGLERAERQQARQHSKEVSRFDQRDQQSARVRREQAEKDKAKVKKQAEEDKAKVKEQAENEEGFGNDLDDDAVDGSE